MSVESSETSAISDLAERVADLELKVFGNLDKNETYAKANDVLLDFSTRLAVALNDQERAMMVAKRLDELERYLDPICYDELAAGHEQLTAELVCVQPQLSKLATRLKLIDQLIPLLDSQHITDVAGMRERVDRFKQRHQTQMQRQKRLIEQLHQLKHQCCQMVDSLALAAIDLDAKTAKAAG